jgi:hypothetical protein
MNVPLFKDHIGKSMILTRVILDSLKYFTLNSKLMSQVDRNKLKMPQNIQGIALSLSRVSLF